MLQPFAPRSMFRYPEKWGRQRWRTKIASRYSQTPWNWIHRHFAEDPDEQADSRIFAARNPQRVRRTLVNIAGSVWGYPSTTPCNPCILLSSFFSIIML